MSSAETSLNNQTKMITPTPTVQQFAARVNATDLTALITAIAAANIVTLPTGKTLADVANLNLNVFPAAQQDGTVAIINASIT